jgi:hypothetical protein
MELWGLETEEDLAFWKRMLFIAIGVVVAAGILVVLYFLYETYVLGKKGTMAASDQLQASAQQQRIIKSLTAPAQEPGPSTARPSGAQAHDTGSASIEAYSGEPVTAGNSAPKPPSTLNAPATQPKTPADQAQEEATINSLTAPSK